MKEGDGPQIKTLPFTPRFKSKNSSRKSYFRMKSQKTVDTTSHKSEHLILPSITGMNQSISYKDSDHNHQSVNALVSPTNSFRTRLLGLPLMNDDFNNRKAIYKQSFLMGKSKIIQLEIANTSKFYYITIYDTKCDMHFKLRLVQETGRAIYERFKGFKLQFKKHIFRDDMKRYYLSAPFPPFERKFYFTKMSPSNVTEPECEEEDLYLKETIKNLDRTEFIFKLDTKKYKSINLEHEQPQ